MLDVDRRSFVAGISLSSLPIPAGASINVALPHADIAALLRRQLGLSHGTADAMASRAQRFVGNSCTVLTGASNGQDVELGQAANRSGSWLLRGVAASEAHLADAVGFACPRAAGQLGGVGASFRWFSGCSFGAATAHLFLGNKSSLFVVTHAQRASVIPKRLDIVLV